MAFLFEIAEPGTVELLLVSIPESLGLLVFGIALVAVAVLIRSFLGKASTVEKVNEKVAKKA